MPWSTRLRIDADTSVVVVLAVVLVVDGPAALDVLDDRSVVGSSPA